MLSVPQFNPGQRVIISRPSEIYGLVGKVMSASPTDTGLSCYQVQLMNDTWDWFSKDELRPASGPSRPPSPFVLLPPLLNPNTIPPPPHTPPRSKFRVGDVVFARFYYPNPRGAIWQRGVIQNAEFRPRHVHDHTEYAWFYAVRPIPSDPQTAAPHWHVEDELMVINVENAFILAQHGYRG